MNRILSFLFQLGILAGLLATFGIPCLVADRHLGLSQPWPAVIGIASLITTLFVIYLGLIRSQRNEQKVLSTSNHPVFGKVRCLRDRWEASIEFKNGWPMVDIGGDSPKPSSLQASTYSAVCDRYSELLSTVVSGAQPVAAALGINLQKEHLLLEAINLAEREFGTFSLVFSVPPFEKEIPWGLSADFTDFALREVSDNH